MSWVGILSDTRGRDLSELPGHTGLGCNVPVVGMGTGTFTLPLDHPDADFVLEADGLLRVYEVNDNFLVDGDRVLHHHGRIVTADEVAQADRASVAVTTADPYWATQRRLIGKSPTGYSRGTALAPVDRGQVILTELLNAANAEAPTGLAVGNVAASSSTYVSGWYYKPLSESIVELGATLDGPDWRVRPIEFVDTGGPVGYYGALDVAPTIGSLKPGAVFEYGPEGLGNAAGYKRGVSLEGMATRAFHLPPGFPDNATQAVLMAEDASAIAARGLFEVVVAADLTPDQLRLLLLQQHVAIRKQPRQVITFDPVRDPSGQRIPRLGVDLNVGDIVPFRASYQRGDGTIAKRVDALTRIYNIGVTVDPLGVGTVSLTTVPQG